MASHATRVTRHDYGVHQRRRLALVVAAAATIGPIAASAARAQVAPVWAGSAQHRVLVRVIPANLGSRPSDDGVARLNIDFDAALAAQFGAGGVVDMDSVQIQRYDPTTGLRIGDGNWAYGKTSADRPFRWYDSAIPAAYQEMEDNISATNGALTWVTRNNYGYFYDATGNWKSGAMAWTHTQTGAAPSYYAIYFNTLPATTVPWTAEPRGFLGDGLHRTTQLSTSSTGTIHTRIDVDDFDGDGKLDLVAGNSRGGMSWYKNLGTADTPRYGSSKILFTTDGKPIDVSWSSSPKIVDWDGDGLKDIISGGERNRAVWYKNVGTNSNRAFQYKGYITNPNGTPFELPTTPVPEGQQPDGSNIYTLDYYPVFETVDWNNDGRKDLVAGGYITGRLYLYLNTGSKADGTPILSAQGPIQADGKPIDVVWAAAPSIADVNGDGKFDIISGNMKMTAGGGDAGSGNQFLQYFQNTGTAAAPAFTEKPLPKDGTFAASSLGTPRLADYNNDGALDLVVSSNTQIHLWDNVGASTFPIWRVFTPALTSKWGSAPLGATQFVDWNGDGKTDMLQGLTVAYNTGQGNPGFFGAPQPVLGPGQTINHLSGIGDDWAYQRLYDLDADGRVDAMDADHDGKIWFHKNHSSGSTVTFDTTGVVLMQTNGQPIDVGPNASDPPFDQQQGSRATYAVKDFNLDGAPDLVVGNFRGEVRYYQRVGGAGSTTFTVESLIGNLGIRCTPFATDWTGDGIVDVLAAAHTDRFMLIRGTGTSGSGMATFAPGEWVNLPGAPYGAGGTFLVSDFNADGDDDIILVTPYGYMTWIDRSFFQRGYQNATLLGQIETGPRVWRLDANGTWPTAANWTGGAPNAAGAGAYFGSAITAPRTVTLSTPQTVGTLSFDNASAYTIGGAATLSLDAPAGNAAINVFNGNHTIAAPLTLKKSTDVVIGAGNKLTIGSQITALTGVTLTKAGAGTLEVRNLRAGGLAVNAGLLKITPNGGAAGVSKVATLSIAAGATLDLANNKLVATDTPIGAATTPSGSGRTYDGLQGMVQRAKNGDAWSGNGLTSSLAAGSGGLTTIGIATGAQAKGGIGATETALWGGQTVTGSDILAMYTYAGDANLDGAITGDDYSAIDFGILFPGMDGYANGDFNYDGYVTGDDYSVIDLNILLQGAPFPTGGTASAMESFVTAVPEPSACGFALFGAAMTLLRRRVSPINIGQRVSLNPRSEGGK